MGESLPNHHEDHIAGKGEQFITAIQFGLQKCIPMPQAIKIPAANSRQWTSDGKNWRNFRRGT